MKPMSYISRAVSLMCLAAMLLVSCAKEPAADSLVSVDFGVTASDPSLKSDGEAASFAANFYYVAVYICDANGNPNTDTPYQCVESELQSGSTRINFSINLIGNQKYLAVVWVGYKDEDNVSIYNIGNMSAVRRSEKYENVNNTPVLDAWCGHSAIFTAGSGKGVSITAKRPFAKLNVQDPDGSGSDIESVTFAYKAPLSYNALEDCVNDEYADFTTEASLNAANISEVLTESVSSISVYDYLFVPESYTLDVLKVSAGGQDSVSLSSLQLRRNYTTNVIGNIFN